MGGAEGVLHQRAEQDSIRGAEGDKERGMNG